MDVQAAAGTAGPEADGRSGLFAWSERLWADNRRYAAAMLAVIALQIALIVAHEPWLDEWQALQIAAHSPSLAALLENLRYEGHPPLWYLLLQAVLLVVPFPWALHATLLPIALAGQALILLRAPFARTERLLLTTGVLVLFEYFTLSRSLSLGVMTAIALLAFWNARRSPWIAIAILPMCDFLFGIFSVIAVAARWRERALWWPGVALWLVSGLVSAWSVIPAPDMVPALKGDPMSGLIAALAGLGTSLLPLQADGLQLEWNHTLPFGLGVIACPLFLWFCFRQTRHDRWALAAMGGFILLIIGFSMFAYPLQFRHVSLTALLLILIRWRFAHDGVQSDTAFRLWLLAGSLCGLIVAGVALTRPFDRAQDVAQWIERHGLTDERWLVFPDSRGQAVSARSGILFERLDQGCRTSFVRWNQRETIEGSAELRARLRRNIAARGRGYLLAEWDLTPHAGGLLREIARFKRGYDGQDYRLYIVGPGTAPRPDRAPFCVSSMRAAGG